MGIDKNKIIVKELENENEVLKERILELDQKNIQLEQDNKIKERVINDILNSKTFKFADKLGRIFRSKK